TVACRPSRWTPKRRTPRRSPSRSSPDIPFIQVHAIVRILRASAEAGAPEQNEQNMQQRRIPPECTKSLVGDPRRLYDGATLATRTCRRHGVVTPDVGRPRGKGQAATAYPLTRARPLLSICVPFVNDVVGR